ncbi:rpoC2 [Acrasis kona]|uniref:RpoC2 n=1 Tax=Acrasis kona TaxID=1008807 RepID=A0AAW2Z8K1_9EUKA
MLLTDVVEKHRKEGVVKIPKEEQFKLIVSLYGEGGLHTNKLKDEVAKYFGVEYRYSYPEKPNLVSQYFDITEQEAAEYASQNFETLWKNYELRGTSDGFFIRKCDDGRYEFLSRERGGFYSQGNYGDKSEVINVMAGDIVHAIDNH